MEITGWVAIAAFVATNGQTHIAVNDDLHRTEAECIAKQEEAKPRIEAADFVAAYGQACVKVTLKDKPKGPST